MQHSKIIIDWLQFSMLKISDVQYTNITIRKTSLRTKIFEEINEVFYNDIKIGTLASKPLSSILDNRLCLFKFENHILYEPLLKFYFNEIINLEGFKFNNFTRIDLCIDFQQFQNNLSPSNFIKNFILNKYIKCGTSEFKMYSKQQNQAVNKNDFMIIKQEPTYIRFGSNTSNVSAYLYNKTLEINQASRKNYIIDLHKRSNFDNTKDVWRLEFSLKNIGSIHLLTEYGELLNINTENIMDIQFLTNIMHSLINNYFHFKFNGNKKNKARLKDVTLFKSIDRVFKFMHYNNSHYTTIQDKCFINKFEEFNCQLREQKKLNQLTSDEFLTEFLTFKQLGNWYKSKIKK